MYLKFYVISQIYSTHLRFVYDTTETILAVLYREVSHMLSAKYQPNQFSGSGEAVVRMVFTIYGHDGHTEL